jgi:hypothetical protein
MNLLVVRRKAEGLAPLAALAGIEDVRVIQWHCIQAKFGWLIG